MGGGGHMATPYTLFIPAPKIIVLSYFNTSWLSLTIIYGHFKPLLKFLWWLVNFLWPFLWFRPQILPNKNCREKIWSEKSRFWNCCKITNLAHKAYLYKPIVTSINCINKICPARTRLGHPTPNWDGTRGYDIPPVTGMGWDALSVTGIVCPIPVAGRMSQPCPG